MRIYLKTKTDGKNLIVYCDEKEKGKLEKLLEDIGEEFDRDGIMLDVFEHLVCNSDLNWVRPEEVGALTDAPILATMGEVIYREEEEEPFATHVGKWEVSGKLMNVWHKIDKFWGFMDYQVTSPQRQLLETGKCVFIGGN